MERDGVCFGAVWNQEPLLSLFSRHREEAKFNELTLAKKRIIYSTATLFSFSFVGALTSMAPEYEDAGIYGTMEWLLDFSSAIYIAVLSLFLRQCQNKNVDACGEFLAIVTIFLMLPIPLLVLNSLLFDWTEEHYEYCTNESLAFHSNGSSSWCLFDGSSFSVIEVSEVDSSAAGEGFSYDQTNGQRSHPDGSALIRAADGSLVDVEYPFTVFGVANPLLFTVVKTCEVQLVGLFTFVYLNLCGMHGLWLWPGCCGCCCTCKLPFIGLVFSPATLRVEEADAQKLMEERGLTGEMVTRRSDASGLEYVNWRALHGHDLAYMNPAPIRPLQPIKPTPTDTDTDIDNPLHSEVLQAEGSETNGGE